MGNSDKEGRDTFSTNVILKSCFSWQLAMANTWGRQGLLLPERPHSSHSLRFVFSLLHKAWLRVLRQTLCPLTGGGSLFCPQGQQRWKSNCLASFLLERAPGLPPGGSLEICSSELWTKAPFLVSCEPGVTFSNQRLPLFPMGSHSMSQPQARNFLTLSPGRPPVFPLPSL